MEHLNGIHALVTGGNAGIGLGVARALAGAGADVTITGRRRALLDEAAAMAPRLHPLPMDVTDEASVGDGIAFAVEQRGPVAICVANAGIAEGRGVLKTDLTFWRQTMATNLDGAFLTIRECLREMETLDWGRVIAVSSVAGVRGLKGAAAYTASKHGMIGLIRGLSEDYMGTGLTFNALCPGYVDTDIVARQVPRLAEKLGMDHDEARGFLAKGNRHRRLLEVEEVTAAAMWLVGPGSQSVNGQTVEIAGGQM